MINAGMVNGSDTFPKASVTVTAQPDVVVSTPEKRMPPRLTVLVPATAAGVDGGIVQPSSEPEIPMVPASLDVNTNGRADAGVVGLGTAVTCAKTGLTESSAMPLNLIVNGFCPGSFVLKLNVKPNGPAASGV